MLFEFANGFRGATKNFQRGGLLKFYQIALEDMYPPNIFKVALNPP